MPLPGLAPKSLPASPTIICPGGASRNRDLPRSQNDCLGKAILQGFSPAWFCSFAKKHACIVLELSMRLASTPASLTDTAHVLELMKDQFCRELSELQFSI